MTRQPLKRNNQRHNNTSNRPRQRKRKNIFDPNHISLPNQRQLFPAEDILQLRYAHV